MEWQVYLDHIRADAEKLASAARANLRAPVPCCDGWVVQDLVEHVGRVYVQKTMIVDEGWSERKDRQIEAPAAGLVDWLGESATRLVEVLGAHDPAERVWTWHDPDQTVGFWYRRLAHESLIHRIDAEQAAGLHPSVDELLATDGVDEILTVMMADPPPWGTVVPEGRTARLDVPGHTWTVGLTRFSGTSPTTGSEYTDLPAIEFLDGSIAADAIISGPASDVDRWLWGRGDIGAITISGDPLIAPALRSVAAEATQ